MPRIFEAAAHWFATACVVQGVSLGCGARERDASRGAADGGESDVVAVDAADAAEADSAVADAIGESSDNDGATEDAGVPCYAGAACATGATCTVCWKADCLAATNCECVDGVFKCFSCDDLPPGDCYYSCYKLKSGESADCYDTEMPGCDCEPHSVCTAGNLYGDPGILHFTAVKGCVAVCYYEATLESCPEGTTCVDNAGDPNCVSP